MTNRLSRSTHIEHNVSRLQLCLHWVLLLMPLQVTLPEHELPSELACVSLELAPMVEHALFTTPGPLEPSQFPASAPLYGYGQQSKPS